MNYTDSFTRLATSYDIYSIVLTIEALLSLSFTIICIISFIINKIFKSNSKQYIKYIILSILNPLIYLALLFTILGIGSLFN